MRIEILPDRLIEIKAELEQWSDKSVASLTEIQSIIGKLNFCATTVRSGRVFFSRMLNTLRDMNHQKLSQIQLSSQFKKDIDWWLKIMPRFNGISVIPQSWTGPNKIFSTDAFLLAMGGWSSGEYRMSEFPSYFRISLKLDINELEALAVMIGLNIWAYKAEGQKILIQCDNLPTVNIINSGKTQNNFVQNILREICYICAVNDCSVRVIHIPTKQNRIADFLSRVKIHSKYWVCFLKETRGWNRTHIKLNKSHFQFSNSW